MLVFKTDVFEKLKQHGYTQYRIRKENIIGMKVLTEMKAGKVPGTKTLNTLCKLLDCQPGSLIKYVPDTEIGTENSAE